MKANTPILLQSQISQKDKEEAFVFFQTDEICFQEIKYYAEHYWGRADVSPRNIIFLKKHKFALIELSHSRYDSVYLFVYTMRNLKLIHYIGGTIADTIKQIRNKYLRTEVIEFLAFDCFQPETPTPTVSDLFDHSAQLRDLQNKLNEARVVVSELQMRRNQPTNSITK